MKEYKRYTIKDGATLTMSQWGGSPAELEDKIDNGTLVELPCKVGDVLYYVNKYETTPRIEENKVHTIEIYECMDDLTIRIWTQNGTFYADKMPNVFPTKAEAEAKVSEFFTPFCKRPSYMLERPFKSLRYVEEKE